MDMEGVLTARRCPDDRTAMVEVDRFGTIIDICPTCSGTWFDIHELEAITDRAARRIAKLKIGQCGTEITEERLRKVFARNFALPTETPHRHCPCEGTGMELRERNGVTVDWCPICRGIWCDKGELDAIVHNTAWLLVGTGAYHEIDALPLPLVSETAPPDLPDWIGDGPRGPAAIRAVRQSVHGVHRLPPFDSERTWSSRDTMRAGKDIAFSCGTAHPVGLAIGIGIMAIGAIWTLRNNSDRKYQLSDSQLLAKAVALDAKRRRSEAGDRQDE